ncbi:MAG TPA: serine/threonine-protein kinase [Planctomycetaceae bacterium]|nr:serine/threonine-protein kinase [Planctomycetaceae bacterium]
MHSQDVDLSALDQTVIGAIPAAHETANGASPAAKVEFVSGSGPKLETETQALLRIRLRAAAIVLLVAVAAFFVRGFFVEDSPARWAQVIVVLAMAAVVSVLTWKALTLSQLRWIEAATFALIAIYLGIYERELVLLKADVGNPAFELAAVKSCVLYFFAVILLYGAFIPNTWQRAARVLIPTALVPFAVIGLVRLNSTAVSAIADQVADFEQISDNVIMMTLGVVASLYGTHIINTLRIEAFQARQMGQYRLKERLGAGGMGEVYLAEHCLLKRPCAIKFIHPQSQSDPAAILRFEREVRTTAKLSHWNTVNIFDYGRTEDGTFYYVMEYLHGLNLADLVNRYGPMPPERAIHLLCQVCRALHEAHGAGLVHRDIKPANIFAARLGGICDVAKLLDFGLVKHTTNGAATNDEQDGTISGSPLYMPPEQAVAAGEPDARSDIYSLGATAYYLLTATTPFQETSIVRLMLAHAREPVVPPSQRQTGLPRDLEQIVLKCLAKRPADRFQDALSLERGLSGCANAGSWTDRDAQQWWHEKWESEGMKEGGGATSSARTTDCPG